MRSTIPEKWQFGAKLAVTFVLLGWLASKLDFSHLAARLLAVDPLIFAGAVLAMAGPVFLNALRWQLILRAQGIPLPLRSAIDFSLIALFFNVFLPGSTGGDAARAIYAIAAFPAEKTRIIASVVFDRVVGLMVLLAFGYLTLLDQQDLLGRVEHLRGVAVFLPAILATGLALFGALFLLPSTLLPRRLYLRIHAAMDKGVAGRMLRFLREQREHPALLTAVVLVSIVSFLSNFLSGWFVAHAMGLGTSFTQVIVLLAILYTVISIPISFGGHGLREVTLIGLFAVLSLGRAEDAVAYSLLLLCVQLVWSLAGGIWFLVWRSGSGAQRIAAIRTDAER